MSSAAFIDGGKLGHSFLLDTVNESLCSSTALSHRLRLFGIEVKVTVSSRKIAPSQKTDADRTLGISVNVGGRANMPFQRL